MTPHHISLGYFLRNWREAVNVVKTARRLQRGGYWACMGKPTQSMKAEQKWQLLCSLTWPIATPCLCSVFASCWDCGRSLCVVQHWLMEKDKKLQLSRRKGGKGTLGTSSSVLYPAALRKEVVGGCSQYRLWKRPQRRYKSVCTL